MDGRNKQSLRDAQRGRRIKEAAQAAGITLRDLAVQLEIARPTIYAYVAGTLRVPTGRLKSIAEVTAKPLDFFDQLGDEPGRWDGEMAVKHADALLTSPNLNEAAAFATDALKLVPESAHLSRGRLLQRAGTSKLYLGLYVEAIRHLEDARREFDDAGRKDCQGDCSQSLGYCYLNIGLVEHARDAFAFALQYCDGEVRWQADVSYAAVADRLGEFQEADERLERLSNDTTLPPIAHLYTRANLAGVASNRGHWDLAIERSLPVLQEAMELGLRDQSLERLAHLGLAKLHRGELEEASLWLIRATDAARLTGDLARSTLVRLFVARLYADLGDLDQARAETVAATAEATRHQYRRSEAYGLLQLARLALLRGDAPAALDASVQAQTFSETYRYFVLGVESLVCRADALTRSDRAAEALALLDELAQDPRTELMGEPRAAALFAWSRACQAVGDREGCDRLKASAHLVAQQCGALSLVQQGTRTKDARIYILDGTSLKVRGRNP